MSCWGLERVEPPLRDGLLRSGYGESERRKRTKEDIHRQTTLITCQLIFFFKGTCRRESLSHRPCQHFIL